MSFYNRHVPSLNGMTPTVPFRVVQMIERRMVTTEVQPENFAAWCDVRGIAVTGRNTNPSQRAELQGQPRLAGFCGPMWDGDAIRYEDRATNDELSQ